MTRSLASRLLAVSMLVTVVGTGCGMTGSSRRTSDTPSVASSGPITLATGRDLTGYMQPLVDKWNAAHPSERVTLLQLPEAADDQHAQMVTNLQAKSDRYDVLNIDVVWTAE